MASLTQPHNTDMYVITATRNSRLEIFTFPVGVFDDREAAIQAAKDHKEEFGKHYDYYVYEFELNTSNTSSPPIFML
jgi:hypothetical protein